MEFSFFKRNFEDYSNTFEKITKMTDCLDKSIRESKINSDQINDNFETEIEPLAIDCNKDNNFTNNIGNLSNKLNENNELNELKFNKEEEKQIVGETGVN